MVFKPFHNNPVERKAHPPITLSLPKSLLSMACKEELCNSMHKAKNFIIFKRNSFDYLVVYQYDKL